MSDATPQSYFWLSLACFILFFPMGIVAVVYSIMVTRRAQLGDAQGALKASALARTWCLATLVVFISLVIIAGLAGLHT